MRIYKLSLGIDYINDQDFQQLKTKNLVSVHPNTKSKGQAHIRQGELYLQANKGDLFYVCRSNNSIEFIGMFADNRPLYSTISKLSDWVDREYILLYAAIEPIAYDSTFDKWWSPKNNSTFIEIPSQDLEFFETKILKTVFQIELNSLYEKRKIELEKFEKNLNDYLEIQKYFEKLCINEDYLLNEVNGLSNIHLKKIIFPYLRRRNISKHPVVLLRKRILDFLLEGKSLDKEFIISLKNELDQKFEKKVYHAWSSNFRILYTFLYDEIKPILNEYFTNLIRNLQEDLGIIEYTNFKLVHFDGAQNQGQTTIWFAIFNNTYKTQKIAKQLFLGLDDNFKVGLLYLPNKKINDLEYFEECSYANILSEFKKHLPQILNDNSMKNEEIENYFEILEYKKQIILQGPPGTGKTKLAKDISLKFLGLSKTEELKNNEQFKLIQFHPSYTYEDFVRGIEAQSKDEAIEYKSVNKTLGAFAKKALSNYEDSQKDQSTISREIKINEYFKDFSSYLSDELEKNDSYLPLTENVGIIGIEEDAFRYKNIQQGWNKLGNRMLFKDILQAYFDGNLERQDLKKNSNLSGLAIQHASYFVRVLNMFQEYLENHTINLNENELEKIDLKNYVLIIDEINRANLSAVLGELIYALEYRGESVESMYEVDGKKELILPPNLYIIGTMNTADRSVGHIDYAIRRRFAFDAMLPKDLRPELGEDFQWNLFLEVSKLFVKNAEEYLSNQKVDLQRSEYLSEEFNPEDIWLGHSYFIQQYELDELGNDDRDQPIDFNLRLQYEIKPILQEYVNDGILKEKAKEIILNLNADA